MNWTLGSKQDGTPTVFDGLNRLVATLAPVSAYDSRRGSPETPEGQAANARLIAAAPDMLSALRCVATCSRYPDDEPENMAFALEHLRELAMRAIAKAEGVAEAVAT